MAISDAINLASNQWLAGANNQLASTDIYKTNSSTVITNLTSIAESKLSSTIAGMLSGGSTAGIDITTAKNWLSTVNGLASGQSVLSRALSSVGEATSVAVQVGSEIVNVAGSGLSELGDLAKLAGEYTGVTDLISVIDTEAITGVASGIINTATSLGIPSILNEVLAVAGTSNVSAIISKSLPNVVKYANVSDLLAMASNTNVGSLLSVNPTIISDFSSNYVNNSGVDYASSYYSLTKAYTATDSDWMTTSRSVTTESNTGTSTSTETVLDLTTVINGSSDFQDVIGNGVVYSTVIDTNGVVTSNNTDSQLLALGSSYDSSDVVTILGNDFEYTSIEKAEVTNTDSVNTVTVLTSSSTETTIGSTSTVKDGEVTVLTA